MKIFSILGVNLFGGKFGRCVAVRAKVILPAAKNFSQSNIDIMEKCSAENRHFVEYLENPIRFKEFNNFDLETILPKIYNKNNCLDCIS